MTDVTWGWDKTAELQIRGGTAAESYMQQCLLPSVRGSEMVPARVTDSLSSRYVGPPHLPGLTVFIDNAIFLRRLSARNSDTPVKDLRSSGERKRENGGFRENWRWSAGALHLYDPLNLSPTFRSPPHWLLSSNYLLCSTLTQRRLDSSWCSSSASVKTRLSPLHQLLLLSSSRIGTELCSSLTLGPAVHHHRLRFWLISALQP